LSQNSSLSPTATEVTERTALKSIIVSSLILTSIWIDLLTVSTDQILADKHPFFSSVLLGIFCQYLCNEELQMRLSALTEKILALLGNPFCWKFFF